MRESTELTAPGAETEARSESPGIAPAADRTGGVLYAYRAFMSYSHAADGLLVAALQDHLQRFAKPWYRRRAIRVFRDTTGLAVTPDLWHAIRTALAASEYFILFASERAAQSQWIEQEVDFWLRQRAVEQMLIAWTDGKLQWDPAAADFDWARTTCLPPRLRGALRSEPLHLDLRWARTADDLSPRKPEFFDAVARFSAVLRGQPLDELIGEDVRQHRRTRRFATAAVGTLAGLLIVAVLAALTAIQQRNVARAERAIAEEQRTQSRERLLRLTVANGLRRIDERDFSGAGLWFAEALRMAPNTAVQATPERIRFAATLRAHPLLAQAWATTAKTPGRWINLSRDAHYATVGDGQEVRLYDVASGVEVPLQLPSNGHRVLAIDADDLHLIAADGEAGAVLWNVRSGAEVLRLDHAGGLSDADFSADGRLILTEGKDNTLRVWDRQTGRLAETFTLTGKLAFAGFGAASRNIFAVTDERIAHVWTLAPKAHIALAHKELVEVVKVAPDGRRALSTDAHEVRVWDTATGEPGRLPGELARHRLRGMEQRRQIGGDGDAFGTRARL
jgi:MTH538 TIR-like domain (DUF1863)